MSHGNVCQGYLRGHLIGRGTYGSVYEYTREADKKKLAVKIIEIPRDDPDDIRVAARLEAQLMRSLSHEYLIPCDNYLEDSFAFYIFMELADEDLSKYLAVKKRIDERIVLRIMF